MNNKLKHNLKGKTFGRLHVIERTFRPGDKTVLWKCLCECGKNTVVASHNLVRTKHSTKSCGCWIADKTAKRNYRHGMSRTEIYKVWDGMLKRCDPNRTYKNNYIKRNIKVCKRWKNFSNFYADMGDRPKGYTIERINNNKGYSKSNCKWATPKEQARNKKSNVKIRYQGQTYAMSELCEKLKIKYTSFYDYYRKKKLGLKKSIELSMSINKHRKIGPRSKKFRKIEAPSSYEECE